MLRQDGWRGSHGRVERIWRQKGQEVSREQPKKGRIWLNENPVVRLRPEYRVHVWSYDWVHERTHDDRPPKILIPIDGYSRECLALRVSRRMASEQVLEILAKPFVCRSVADHIRSANGPEFTATVVRGWLERLVVKALFIEPGSAWERWRRTLC